MESNRKVLTGRVVSTAMQKTAVVEVVRTSQHPIYRKVVRRAKKYLVHDEDQACQVGDEVRIVETRPLSRRKHFQVVEVVRRSHE